MTKLMDEDRWRVVRGVPADLRDVLKLDGRLCLAGGCIRALVAGETVSDYDVFGPDPASMVAAARGLMARRQNEGYTVMRLETPNAVTLLTVGRTPVQFVTRWCFPDAEAAIRTFDFTVAQAALAWREADWATPCADEFYPDLAARRLRYTFPERDEDACGSLLRIPKMVARGYVVPAESLAGAIARAIRLTPELGVTLPERVVAAALAGRIREVDPLGIVDATGLTEDGR